MSVKSLLHNLIPFIAGVAAGAYLLLGASQGEVEFAAKLAPVSAVLAYFIPDTPAIALNGLAYMAVVAAVRYSWTRRRPLAILILAFCIAYACSAFGFYLYSGQLLPYSEVVLQPGMKLNASTPSGALTITAGKGTRRTYQGDGWTKSLLLVPRTSRWFGSLGLYDPAVSYSPNGRVLVEEGRQHFSTRSQAEGWLRGRSREAGVGSERLVFTSNGLVLRYSLQPAPGSGISTAHVDLWQIYVGGRRPEGLPGGDDAAIRVEGGHVAEYSTPQTR